MLTLTSAQEQGLLKQALLARDRCLSLQSGGVEQPQSVKWRRCSQIGLNRSLELTHVQIEIFPIADIHFRVPARAQ